MVKLPPLQKAHIEQVLYPVASHTIVDYVGGQWKFSRKGQIYYIDSKEEVKANAAHHEVTTTRKAATIACSLIAANNLSWKAHRDHVVSAVKFWSEVYHFYRDVVWGDDNVLGLTEDERGAIYQIID